MIVGKSAIIVESDSTSISLESEDKLVNIFPRKTSKHQV